MLQREVPRSSRTASMRARSSRTTSSSGPRREPSSTAATPTIRTRRRSPSTTSGTPSAAHGTAGCAPTGRATTETSPPTRCSRRGSISSRARPRSTQGAMRRDRRSTSTATRGRSTATATARRSSTWEPTSSYRRSAEALAEAEDELRVVGHQVRRPGRLPGQLDLDVLEVREPRRHDRVDVLLDHGPGRAPHRGQAVDHLDVRPVDLDVVEQAELDDVHPELGVLDGAERFEDLFASGHATSLEKDGSVAEQPDFLAALTCEEVVAVDELHPVAARAHDQRVRAGAVGEEPDAAEQVAGRDARRGEDHVAGGQVLEREDPVDVVDAELGGRLDLAAGRRPQLRLQLAAEAPQRRRRQHRLPGPADADRKVVVR